ncbi:MAG: hypothetical protein GYA55_08670 [SAR324 cluster bacterium]|uniref:Uncharacterized protein n=1 Tax=SAR324 cluster bacterium TaxID=2024889 RepID=A0A7X9FS40_9DELT|nr:hypothetical protein [SAR324 cluster bacterium]
MDNSQLIRTTLIMYKECAKEASLSLIRNWRLLVMSTTAFITFMFAAFLVGPLGFAGSFILGMVSITLLTYYYSWLSECTSRNTLRWEDYIVFDSSLFSPVINTAFILFIFSLLISQFGVVPNMLKVITCINLGVFIIFSALPEILYFHRYQGITSFVEAYNFIKDNWIEWFIPLLFFFSPLLIQNPIGLLNSLSSGDPLLPVLKFLSLFSESLVAADFLSLTFPPLLMNLALSFLSIVAATWFMLFRGFLFRELESGSRRQRAFIASQR